MMHQRKAQSSIEYLGTYAWAFMGLLVTLGAMSYFGVFNPNTYSAESCQSGAQVSCNDYLAATNGQEAAHFLFQFKNNYPKDIVITKFHISEPVSWTSEPNMIVQPSRLMTVSLANNTYNLPAGQMVDIDFTITYMRSGGVQEYTINGDALVEVITSDFQFSGGLTGGEPFCGDGTVDNGDAGTVDLGEECDDPPDAPSMIDGRSDYTSTQCGGYACRSDCTCIGECGDEVIQQWYSEALPDEIPIGPEQCDTIQSCQTGLTCAQPGETRECECI